MHLNHAKWFSIFVRARQNKWWQQALEAALYCSPGVDVIFDVAVDAYIQARGTSQGRAVRKLLVKHGIHVDVRGDSAFTFTGPTTSRTVTACVFKFKSFDQILREHFERIAQRKYCSCGLRSCMLTQGQRRFLRKKKAEIRRRVADPEAQKQAIERMITSMYGPPPVCEAHPSIAT